MIHLPTQLNRTAIIVVLQRKKTQLNRAEVTYLELDSVSSEIMVTFAAAHTHTCSCSNSMINFGD